MTKSYFNDDLSSFVCACCKKEGKTGDDTLVVYGDVPYARQKDGDNAWVSVPATALPVPKVDVVEDMKDFAVEAK